MRTRELVVVAGATGYAGGHVARALHAAGYRVRALSRSESKAEALREFCDEVFVGQATEPETLRGLFEGARFGFSSIGIRHMKRHPTFLDVDRDANLALVREAERAGVERYGFISVFRGDELRGELEIADAREQVVDALRESPMAATILRPTGFFNDMGAWFDMAQSGRVWLLGDGSARLNPIHGADLGTALVDGFARDPESLRAVPLGGPDTFSAREIGELAFEVLGRAPRFGHIPGGLVSGAGRVMRPFNANLGALITAFASMSGNDAVAPAWGTHHLEAHFRGLAEAHVQAA